VNDPTIVAVIDQLRRELPPVFAGPKSDELTGGAIHWPTIQNRRSKGEIPDICFLKAGRRVLVRRDPFLAWWAATLSEVRQSSDKHPRTTPPTPKAGRTRSARVIPDAGEASP
jgi:hypothetical protein